MSHPPNLLAAELPGTDAKTRAPKSRRWRVIHACEFARDVLCIVEGQVAAGMFPYIVTPHGAGSAELYLSNRPPEPVRPLSLLRSWQDVRQWRKAIMDCDPENSADLLHAHSFPAGMAAVRSCACVVYDLDDCIDEMALAAGQCNPGSWMGRSFRAAEQFVLSRAAAVIVHSLGMKDAARERGAPADSIFLVPHPISAEDAACETTLSAEFEQQTVNFLAAQPAAAHDKLLASSLQLVEAFARTVQEHRNVRLLLEAQGSVRSALLQSITVLNLKDHVVLVDPLDMPDAWLNVHVVVALGTSPTGAVEARRANDVCLNAMRRGIALLAADVPRNRDVSTDGRGCLWFEGGNPRDLAGRMTFLAGHPDFRIALARAGRSHLLETRSPAVIGRAYDEIYRHAMARKKSAGTGPGLSVLHPAANCA